VFRPSRRPVGYNHYEPCTATGRLTERFREPQVVTYRRRHDPAGLVESHQFNFRPRAGMDVSEKYATAASSSVGTVLFRLVKILYKSRSNIWNRDFHEPRTRLLAPGISITITRTSTRTTEHFCSTHNIAHAFPSPVVLQGKVACYTGGAMIGGRGSHSVVWIAFPPRLQRITQDIRRGGKTVHEQDPFSAGV